MTGENNTNNSVAEETVGNNNAPEITGDAQTETNAESTEEVADEAPIDQPEVDAEETATEDNSSTEESAVEETEGE